MTEQTIDAIEPAQTSRPTFLTVLCILTFVVSGYNFIQSLISIFVSNAMDTQGLNEMYDEIYKNMEGMDAEGQAFMQQFVDAIQITLSAMIENAVLIGSMEMLVSALGVIGAFLMFRLNKKGYYVYILAKAIGVIAPLIIVGANILTLSVYGFISIIGILFIVLYGLNLKYMR